MSERWQFFIVAIAIAIAIIAVAIAIIVVTITNTIAIIVIAIAIAIIIVARSLIEMLFYAAFHPNMIQCLLIVKSSPFSTSLCLLTLQVLEYVETGAEGAAKAIPWQIFCKVSENMKSLPQCHSK